MTETALSFSQIDRLKSQQIYAAFVGGKVLTKQHYVLHRHQFEDNPLYTELFTHVDHFRQLYDHIGFTLNYNVDGAFFYISRSESEEDADINATKIQALLLIIARYWVDLGLDLDDLAIAEVGLGHRHLEAITENALYNEILAAIGIENWGKAMSYLSERNFIYPTGQDHYVISSAGMHFLQLHVEKYTDSEKV